MDIQTFLDKLEITLEKIHVSGRDDEARMLGIFEAINTMRATLAEGVSDDGRQGDIGTDTSSDSK